MKMIYTEPVIEVFLFAKQDQIKASSVVVETTKKIVEDQIPDAEGSAEDFVW